MKLFAGLKFSPIDFNLARTSLFLREGLFLYVTTGGSGKILFSVLFFWISSQCFLIICFSLGASSQNCVTNTSFCILFCLVVLFWIRPVFAG